MTTGSTDTDMGTQTPWAVRIIALDATLNEWRTLAWEEHIDYDVRKVIATVVEARRGHMDGHWAIEAFPAGGNESQWNARWDSIENTVTTRVWERDAITHELVTPYVSPDIADDERLNREPKIVMLDPEASTKLNAWLEDQLASPDSPLAQALAIGLGHAIPSRLDCAQVPNRALQTPGLNLMEAVQGAQTHAVVFHGNHHWWECRRSVWTVLSAAVDLATGWNEITPDRGGPCPH